MVEGLLIHVQEAGVGSAMLAGILFGLCLAPVRTVAEIPALAAPILITWALAWRFARPYAVPLALVVTTVVVLSGLAFFGIGAAFWGLGLGWGSRSAGNEDALPRQEGGLPRPAAT